VSEIERRGRQKKELAPRHIPQEVVPIPIAEVREFVHDALTGTSLTNPIAGALSGFAFFSPHVRYTAVDETHTRIELDSVGLVRGVETLLYMQRRAQVHRFFVALEDELDRRERWKRKPLEGTV
jgi:hypothetical protein